MSKWTLLFGGKMSLVLSNLQSQYEISDEKVQSTITEFSGRCVALIS
jgi:hypothetical protein